MLPKLHYTHVFAVAVRLMRGETVEYVDRHGRVWRADATTLHLVVGGRSELIVEGYAADIAVEIVRRRAPSRSGRP
jgi:hypothetical protein